MISWLVALGLLLLILGYSIGVRHGCSLGKTERETLRDGLDAALRRAAEIPPFHPPVLVQQGRIHQWYRRPMSVTPRESA
jgi:hypothetical protein